jgi:predicted lactoylglutathione lyase
MHNTLSIQNPKYIILSGTKTEPKIFVNLPAKNLPKSKESFGKLGFTFKHQFTDDTAACMVLTENAYSMLLTHPKFKEFAPKAIADATKSTEVLVALSCGSCGEVDELVAKAVDAGGSKRLTSVQDDRQR